MFVIESPNFGRCRVKNLGTIVQWCIRTLLYTVLPSLFSVLQLQPSSSQHHRRTKLFLNILPNFFLNFDRRNCGFHLTPGVWTLASIWLWLSELWLLLNSGFCILASIRLRLSELLLLSDSGRLTKLWLLSDSGHLNSGFYSTPTVWLGSMIIRGRNSGFHEFSRRNFVFHASPAV